MKTENYYLLLDLPYDPPEHDYDKIKKAIQKKRSIWTKRLSNAKYKSEAEEFLRVVKKMEEGMQDHNFRKNEALAAKKIIENEKKKFEKEKYERLDELILILSQKGYIFESELLLIKQEFSFTQQEIETKVTNVTLKTDEKFKNAQTNGRVRPALTKEKMKSINDLLDKLIKEPKVGRVPSLYDLIDLPESSYEKEVYDKANREYKALSNKGAGVSGDLLLRKDALSQVLTIFKDQETRLKYDESLKLKRFERMTSFVKIAGCTGELHKNVFEEIKTHAMNEGLPLADAEVRIKRLCEEENINILTTDQPASKEEMKREQCGYCGLVNKSNGKKCTGCGESLTVSCLKCHISFPSLNKHCPGCGLSHVSVSLQNEYIKRAEWSIMNKDYSSAEEWLEKAKYYWAGRMEIDSLSKKISQTIHLVEQQAIKIEQLMKESKFYQAESELIMLRRMHPSFEDIPIMERRIRRYINGAEAFTLKAKSSASDKEKIKFLLSALEESADCEEALKELRKFPPEPPNELRASTTQDAIKLDWKSPYKKDEVVYVIYRQEGDTSASKVGETAACTFQDKKAEPGVRYSYYIQSKRDQKVSEKSSVLNNLVRISEVEKLNASVTDEGIHLTWKSPKKTRIEVWRQDGNIPSKRGDGIKLSGVKQNEVWDRNAETGKEYGYLVILQYEDAQGRPLFSRGNGVKLIHTTASVGTVSVEEKDSIHFHWMPPSEGEVKLFSSVYPFDKYQQDQCFSYHTLLAESGNEVITSSHEGSARKERDFSGGIYILPVLKIGDNAIIGKQLTLKSVQPVSKVFGKKDKADLLLKWDWPDESQKVTIHYSHKGYQDPSAETRECSRFSYENFDGYRLDGIGEKQDTFVTIFVTEEWNGEKIHSKPVHYLYTEREPIEIRYSIAVQRKFFKKDASIKIKVPDYGLPNLVLVKQKGRMPNRKGDGEIIERYESSMKYSDDYIVTSLNDHLEDDCYAKLFFETKNDARNFKIVAEPGAKFSLFS
ncbi:MAG: hypothetical protein ACQEWE_16050 [Bacillota bacterium]